MHRGVHERIDLHTEGDLEEGEQEEPQEAVDEVEGEDLGDQPVLVHLHGAVVLEDVEPHGDLVEDDEVEELERDAPHRRVEAVEEELAPQLHVGRLDVEVAEVKVSYDGYTYYTHYTYYTYLDVEVAEVEHRHPRAHGEHLQADDDDGDHMMCVLEG